MELKIIFMAALGVVSIVYLITLTLKESRLQFILKGCLVPLILAVYVTSANKILLTVVLALVFGWLGDVLLIKISNPLRFKLGLASFLTGHILYIVTMITYARPFNINILIISIIAAACYGIIIFKVIKPPQEMKIPVVIYEATLMTMAIFALQFFLAHRELSGAFVFAGSVCFVASDTMLTLLTFHKKPLFVHVMVTYIAAQLLISLGLGYLG